METLAYLPLEWDCQFERDTLLPAFKGSMLRGALGHALKSVVCAVREKDCDRCLLRKNCLYARIFEYKPNRQKEASQAAFPHPYVLEYPAEDENFFGPKNTFTFRTVLMGPYVESFPYWIYSIQKMGQNGLGPRQANGYRSRFQLKQVRFGGQVIYEEGQSEIRLPEPIPTISWQPTEDPLEQLQINLETPLRYKRLNKMANDVDFTELIRLGLRRLKSLQDGFQVRLEPENLRELIPLSGQVEVLNKELRWQEQTRYSTRQGSPQQMGGLVGRLAVRGDLRPFWPLLKIAQITHLGKETSFGLGRVTVESL